DVAVVERGTDRGAESGSPVRRHPRRPGRVRYAGPLSSNRAMAPAYWQRREVGTLGPMLNESSVPCTISPRRGRYAMSDSNEAAGSIAPPRQRTGPRGPAPARGANVPAVARAARLLDTLAAAKQAMTLAALVKALGLPKSTVHGLCATLAQANL